MIEPKKPSRAAIRRSPMSPGPDNLRGNITRCNVCGEESWGDLLLWRACDEFDRPIPGYGAIVFIDYGHPRCEQAMQGHPRLFEQETGTPGSFPSLCRDCVYREGLECEHPNLKSNGGSGLEVHTRVGDTGMFICGEDGAVKITQRALRCVGFSYVRPVRSILTLGAMCEPKEPS